MSMNISGFLSIGLVTEYEQVRIFEHLVTVNMLLLLNQKF
jgi:hypothetical protein